MDDLKTTPETWPDEVQTYLKAQLKLHKLIFLEEATRIFSRFFSFVTLLVFICMVLFFLAIGSALVVGEWLENVASGYFVMAGALLLMGLLVYYAGKKWIQRATLVNLQELIFGYHEHEEE